LKLHHLDPRSRVAGIAPITGARIETILGTAIAGIASESPPSRGRGLKHSPRRWLADAAEKSPPSRGRGLKLFADNFDDETLSTSPPSRGRGLKHSPSMAHIDQPTIAPITGARIETASRRRPCPSCPSPPSRGRGLKLPWVGHSRGVLSSPPSRGRGLKHAARLRVSGRHRIAPITGARIETARPRRPRRPWRISPPSRGRGLKQVSLGGAVHVRGIAPITGARIETGRRYTICPQCVGSPPSRGRGLKL